MDETNIVGQFTDARQQVAGHLARLTPRPEFPPGLNEVPLFPLEGDQPGAIGHRFVVIFDQLRFVVEGVDMGDRSRNKDQQNPLGFGREVR